MPTVEGEFVDLSGRGIRLHYRDWGGAGETVLLLHGLSSSSRIWDWTAPLLTGDFRVIALDLRGHGLSDCPDDGYDFGSVSVDVGAFLEAVGVEKAVMVGHSWGGSVALHFAAANPDAATALVMVDGGFISLSERLSWEEAERVMRPPEIDGVPVETFVGFMRKLPQFAGRWNDELADMVLANFDVRDGGIYRRLSIPNHMKIARALYGFNARDRLSRLPCPALAISCRREPVNDAERQWQEYRSHGLARLAEIAPSVRVHVMEDTIHDVPIQRPEELVSAILEFVKDEC